jgi:cob(I)alamin adenosyltransferase
MHLARTVARRAERQIVALSQEEEINPEVLKYVNRLSDLLFLVARWINHQADVTEHHPDYR